jgi:hypothetical protein
LGTLIKLNKSKAYTVLISAHYEKYPTRRFTAITRAQIHCGPLPALAKMFCNKTIFFKIKMSPANWLI